jgi:hypothetical protein
MLGAVYLACSQTASAQLRTELRDPVRGVSFHSVELSEMPINTLEVIEGSFPDSDQLAIGLSAMHLDGRGSIDEYVLWIRHQGRRWLDFDMADPVVFTVDNQPLALTQLRASQPFVGETGRLFEKIEFNLSDEQLSRILTGGSTVITLTSDNGTVQKRLTAQELRYLEEFRDGLLADLSGN